MNKNRQAAALAFFIASLTRVAAAAVPRRHSAAGAAILIAVLMLFPRAGLGQIVTTLAGSGARGSADGAGPGASFNLPQGVAVDQTGNVYVADTINQRIRRIAPGGFVTTLADFCCGRVYGGAVIAVAVDASGNVYATDPIGDGIDGGAFYKITPGGAVTYLWNWYTAIESPAGVAVDASGNIYVVDLYSGLIKITGDGVVTILSKDVAGSGVAVDYSGVLYVADTGHQRILRVTPDGVVTTLAGSGSLGFADGKGTAASFGYPYGVAVDHSGNVYVADTGNNRIRWVTADGVVTTLAGSGSPGGADGTGTTASFNSPRGVAVDCAGNVYVADSGNNMIRKITLTGDGSGRCADNWIVPSTAHSAGANGSFWTSDLTLHNRGSSAVTMTLKFLGHNADGRGGPEKTFALGPYQTITYADVLSSVFGVTNDWGALQVLTKTSQLVVRSRTSTPSGSGSVGDGLPGVRQSTFYTDQTSPSPVLTGLREDDRFRSNIVLVNGSTTPIEVRVTATDGSGAGIGGKSYTLPPLGTVQESFFLLRPEFGGRDMSDVTATISSPTPGGSFMAFAVVIDRGTNASSTVLPQ